MNTRVRRLGPSDFEAAMLLYNTFGGVPPLTGEQARDQFNAVLSHPGTFILGAERDGDVRSMATLHVLPNMTVGGRPYALIENVVTLKRFERRGLARAVIENAIARAWARNAYKIMLLTGKMGDAKGFYEKLGFSAQDKHAMTLRKVPPRQENAH